MMPSAFSKRYLLIALPVTPKNLHNLSGYPDIRFMGMANINDLNDATSCSEDSLSLIIPDRPYHSSYASRLARIYSERFGCLSGRPTDDLERAMTLFRSVSANTSLAEPSKQPISTKTREVLARRLKHSSAEDAYRCTLEQMERALVIYPTMDLQYAEIQRDSTILILSTAACALGAGTLRQRWRC